jgi:heptosyltransferase II
MIIRGVNWLGDAIMSTPALLRLREAHPNAFIGLLTPGKLADLWQKHPAVDAILSFEPGEGLFSVARRVRAGDYDLGLVLPNSFQSALELWWAAVPERIGYAGQMRTWLLTRAVAQRPEAVRMRKRSVREIRRLVRAIESSSRGSRSESQIPNLKSQTGTPNLKSEIGIPDLKSEIGNRKSAAESARAHHIFQYLHLAAHLGANPAPVAPRLFVTEAEVNAFLDRRRIQVVPDRPLFALNPGAEYGPAKRWPVERFIAAAREIQSQTHCRWVILGGQGDRELAERVAAGIESGAGAADKAGGLSAVINLVGATSLRELCAILKACRVLLTNDTGPMHVGAALGTPVVAPFGSTAPELTGPGLPGDPRHRLLRSSAPCAPCFLRECPIDFRCMSGIEVAAVVAAVLSCCRASTT